MEVATEDKTTKWITGRIKFMRVMIIKFISDDGTERQAKISPFPRRKNFSSLR